MLGGAGSVIDSSYGPSDRWVVIEGPPSLDVDFTICWLKAARKACLRWDRLAWDAPEADELWEKLCSYNPMETSDRRPDLSTVVCREMAHKLQRCAQHVRFTLVGALFAYVVAGLLVQTGGRYQMTIPDVIDISKVHERLADWLKRMDQENLGPSDLFVTQTV